MKNYNVCLSDLISSTDLVLHDVYIYYFYDHIMIEKHKCIAISTKNIENIKCNKNRYSEQCEIQIIVDNICKVNYSYLENNKLIKEDDYGFLLFEDYLYKDNKVYVPGEELVILLLLTDLI